MITLLRRLVGHAARATLAPFGKTISQVPTGWTAPDYLWKRIIDVRPDVVLDVGANEGQFATALRTHGFADRLVSFEPQPTVFTALSKRASGDPLWECHQLAAGDVEGMVDMHVSAFSPSSSLLPIGKLHTEVMPNTVEVGSVRVPVVRLDEWAKSAALGGRLFLKLDVQGYELQVLRGATELLHAVFGACIELNFAPLFDGQSKYLEVMGLLEEAGFQFVGLTNIKCHPEANDFLWADGFFLRR